MVKDYKEFYRKISSPFRNDKGKKLITNWNQVITGFIYLLYSFLLLDLITTNRELILPFIFIPGISFLSLSWVRSKLNYPRPYEIWDIQPLIIKESKGNSFPSRHVFSASIIAMCALKVNLTLGIFGLFCSILLACLRVIGGVHFPRDVMWGLVIGLLTGSLLFLF